MPIQCENVLGQFYHPPQFGHALSFFWVLRRYSELVAKWRVPLIRRGYASKLEDACSSNRLRAFEGSVRIPPSSTHIRLLVDGSTKDRFHQLPIAKLSILRILRAETFNLYCYHLDEIIRQQYNETNKTRKQSKHYIEKKKTNNVGQHL